jgi:hypothetical protein
MRRSDWIAAAVAAIVTPLALLGEMPRPGVDIGTDYWRVRYLIDEGLSLTAASHFIETHLYPALAHYIAATLGTLSGSGFMAMIAVAAGAVAVVYAMILAMVRAVSPVAAVIAFIAIVVLMVERIRLVPGSEVVSNFFYPQLLAYAFALIALALLSASYRRREGILLDLTIVAAAHFIALAHLLPALQFLGAYGLVLLIEAIDERTRPAAVRLAVFAVMALTIFLNPSFTIMTTLSAHEGGISYGFKITTFSRAIVFLGALVASGAAMIAFRRDKSAGLFLGAFGCATGAIGLAQWLAFEVAGYGSSYAVSKHMASAGTFAVVNLSCLIGVALQKRFGRPTADVKEWVAFVSLVTSAILLSLGLLIPRWMDNADFLAFQSFVRSNPPPSQPAISYSSKLLPALNFLITIGDLGGSGSGAANTVRLRQPLPPGEYVIFLHDGDEKSIPGCGETLVRENEFRMSRCVVG